MDAMGTEGEMPKEAMPEDEFHDMPSNPYEEDPDVVGYGFEAPPALDAFSPADPYAQYDLKALDCPYDAEPAPVPVDDDAEEEEYGKEEPPPATPEVDYEDTNRKSKEEDASSELTNTKEITPGKLSKADRELSVAAAAELKEAMGIEPSDKEKKKKKKKKKEKSRKSSSTDVEVKKVKSRSRGPSPTQPNPIEVMPLPTDTPSTPTTGTRLPWTPSPRFHRASSESDLDSSMLDQQREVDTVSPNDYLLLHNRTLKEMEGAIGSQGRIKYTCMTASRNYLGFGANTGGAYCFERETSTFLQVLSNGEGYITCLKFAPDERLLAVGLSRGDVAIWSGLWGDVRNPAKLLKVIIEHGSSPITALTWSHDSRRIISGDESGLVIATPVSMKPIVPSTSAVFPQLKALQKVVNTVLPESEVIFRCTSRINQLDTTGQKVSISCATRVYIADQKKRAVYEVGQRLRDGEFGACFGSVPASEMDNDTLDPPVFCARPGARIWVGDSKTGKVKGTMSLKQQFDRSSTPLVRLNGQTTEPKESDGPMGYHFPYLDLVRDRYLLSWNSSMLFVIDTHKTRLGGWYADIKGIAGVASIGEDIYVLHSNQAQRDAARRDRASSPTEAPPLQYHCEHISLLTPGEMAREMMENNKVIDAAEMILEYWEGATKSTGPTPDLAVFMQNVESNVLELLRQQLADLDDLGSDEDKKKVDALETKIADIAMKVSQSRWEQENLRMAQAEAALYRLKTSLRSSNEVVVDGTENSNEDDGEQAV
eukprot:m.81748 g.81748  ORF g.81748 m.81748 type:complete len:766 (+) comp12826_c0_seq2:161-2458(+)